MIDAALDRYDYIDVSPSKHFLGAKRHLPMNFVCRPSAPITSRIEQAWMKIIFLRLEILTRNSLA